MPTSNPKIISPILNKVLLETPETLLDIGVGYGKWGALLREYTDVIHYRFYKSQHKVKIHGIEIHDKYKNPNWDHYNKMFIGDACELIKGLGFYDMIIFTDVIEHIKKDQALELIADLMKRTKKLVLSYCNDEQSNVNDNQYEDHISKWSIQDLEAFGKVEVLHEHYNLQVLFVTPFI